MPVAELVCRAYFSSTKILRLVIQLYYLSNGIISHEKYKKYEPYLYGVTLINSGFVISGLVRGFFQAAKIVHKIQIVSIIFSEVGVSIFKILGHVHKKNLLLTTSNLCEDSKFGLECVTDKVHEKMKNKFFPLIVGVTLSFFILFTLTFFGFLLKSEKDYNDMDYYVAPEMFIFSRVNSFAEYLGVLGLQIIFLTPEVIAYLSLTTYICYVVASLEVHVEKIRYLTENFICSANLRVDTTKRKISTRGYYRIESLKANPQNSIVEQKFQTLVEFQQYTFTYLNNFISYGKWIFNAMLAWFFCTLVLFIFLTDQANNNIMITAKMINVVVSFLIVFYILCYTGDMVSQMNESMGDKFYDTTWFTLKPSLRKWFLTLMILTQERIQLKAFNMFTLDFKLFINTLKIVYSIVNGMKMMQKK